MDHNVFVTLQGSQKCGPSLHGQTQTLRVCRRRLSPGTGSRVPLSCGDKSRHSFDPSVSLSVRLSVCQLVSAVARVAGNEWTCDKWSGA